jgi:hypothetical protein
MRQLGPNNAPTATSHWLSGLTPRLKLVCRIPSPVSPFCCSTRTISSRGYNRGKSIRVTQCSQSG